MTDRIFYDAPPPAMRGGRRADVLTEEVLEDLRNHPTDWTKIHTAKNTTMTTFWNRRFGPEGFRFVSRKVEGEEKYDIWASYIVDDTEEEED